MSVLRPRSIISTLAMVHFLIIKKTEKKLEDVVLRIAKCSFTAALLLLPELEGFPLRMSGIDNSYKIDGDVLLVIHASIPPGVERPTLPRTPNAGSSS